MTSTQSESNGFPAEHGREAIVNEVGDGSDGDGYVEIEQVNEDEGTVHYVPHEGTHYLREDGHTNGYSSAPPQRVIVKHIAKRTMITFQQRAILEEFYQKGMTSASFQLDILHQSAADKTGLDVTVIKVSARGSARVVRTLALRLHKHHQERCRRRKLIHTARRLTVPSDCFVHISRNA